jgi:hypothetical protein
MLCQPARRRPLLPEVRFSGWAQLNSPAPTGCPLQAYDATLPSGSRYCLSCGRPIETNTPRELENPPAAEVFPSPTLVRRAAPLPLRRTSRWLGLSLGAVVLLGGFLWMVSSESPLAQSIQEYVGWKHDEGVLDGSFSIAPGAIQVYTVSLPEGSVGALLFGQFSSQSAVPGTKNGNIVRPADSNVEVFVMTEPAFTNWQSGYNVTSLMKADVHRTGSSAPSCLLRKRCLPRRFQQS